MPEVEVAERAAAVRAEAARALQRLMSRVLEPLDPAGVVLDDDADVVEPRAVLGQVVREDARALERLDQLDLGVARPGERVPERELGGMPVVRHVLEDLRAEL